MAAINYYTDVSASGNAALSREITIGQFNPAINASVNANVRANVDLQMFIPSYVFATPFLGGQASASLLGLYGRNDSSLNATLTGAVGPIPFTRTLGLQQTTWGVGDLIPLFAVRWNAGVNNFMTYMTGDVPVGALSLAEPRQHRIWATARSTAAPATPISIRRPATNFPRCSDSPATSTIHRPTIPAASTCISTGAPRNS